MQHLYNVTHLAQACTIQVIKITKCLHHHEKVFLIRLRIVNLFRIIKYEKNLGLC